LLLAAACDPAAASSVEYWTYSYRGIEVMTSERPQSAKTIAHNLNRLDGAIRHVLDVPQKSDWEAATRVFVVPTATFARLRGKNDDTTSLFMSTPSGNTILIDGTKDSGDASYFNPYFGYTGTVLVSDYTYRYPRWFIYGLSELFAASKISSSSVTIGAASPSRVQQMLDGSLIPIRAVLAVQAGDPQLKNPDFANLYEAESWLLVHLVVLEGKYRTNFFHYFALLDKGEEQEKAFAASFDVPFEDLDKLLRDTLRSNKIQTVRVNIVNEEDSAEPTRLTEAQATGRLAQAATQINPQGVDALQLANEALRLDPKNQDGLAALAQAQLRRSDYAAALEAAERLCTFEPLAQRSYSQCGTLFLMLSDAVRNKKGSLNIDGATLSERSRQYYDKAITADPSDYVSWAGMAETLTVIGNPQLTNAFLPRASQALSARLRDAGLARALAALCAASGDLRSAMNYATMWQISALSSASRDAADAYVSRLSTALERADVKRTP